MKTALICVFLLALSACGYRLRLPPEIGSHHQPMLLITEEKFSEIYQVMDERLTRNDVATTDDVQLALSRLEIFSELEPERETLITTTTGDEQLFVLQWQFRFLQRNQSAGNSWEVLLQDQFISVSKVVNKTQLEQQIGYNIDSVRSQLRMQLADRVLQQLNSFRLQVPKVDFSLL